MGKALFGTDGIRGPFGVPPLDEVTVRRLGAALALHLESAKARSQVLLAGDTRHSTPELCRWLTDGLETHGCHVVFGGVLPTPAIAHLVASGRSAAGVVVSASHNPLPDNGIKLFDAAGAKWEPEAETALAERLQGIAPLTGQARPLPPADSDLGSRYLEHLCGLLQEGRPLEGLDLVLDTANGAASGFADRLFRRLGATVETIAARPDGTNINVQCGSTAPGRLAATVRDSGADIGFAFDGDADRVIAVDSAGTIRDGDALLFVLARHLQRRGQLQPPRLVATSMSNIGLELALARSGIELVRCDVGDREVVQALRREQLLLGGEQSGHIIRLDLAPTGDGLQTALLVSAAVVAAGAPLHDLLEDLTTFPQVLHNVRVARKPDLATLPTVRSAARAAIQELGSDGRLLLRYSGTEPLARIMIEGPDQARIETLAREIAAAIRHDIGTRSTS